MIRAVAQGVQILLCHHHILPVFEGVEPFGVGADVHVLDAHRPDESNVLIFPVQGVHSLVIQAAAAHDDPLQIPEAGEQPLHRLRVLHLPAGNIHRLKAFAVRIIKLVDKLPGTQAGKAIGNQIVRSGTSPGANYRAACIGKSDKDFLNKLKMVEEELDETLYWLELIMELELVKPDLLKGLYQENKELVSIVVKSIITMREKVNGK